MHADSSIVAADSNRLPNRPVSTVVVASRVLKPARLLIEHFLLGQVVDERSSPGRRAPGACNAHLAHDLGEQAGRAVGLERSAVEVQVGEEHVVRGVDGVEHALGEQRRLADAADAGDHERTSAVVGDVGGQHGQPVLTPEEALGDQAPHRLQQLVAGQPALEVASIGHIADDTVEPAQHLQFGGQVVGVGGSPPRGERPSTIRSSAA